MVGCLIAFIMFCCGIALLMTAPVLFFLLLALAVVGTFLLFVVGVICGVLKCFFGWL
jgi:hypothetical protein